MYAIPCCCVHTRTQPCRPSGHAARGGASAAVCCCPLLLSALFLRVSDTGPSVIGAGTAAGRNSDRREHCLQRSPAAGWMLRRRTLVQAGPSQSWPIPDWCDPVPFIPGPARPGPIRAAGPAAPVDSEVGGRLRSSRSGSPARRLLWFYCALGFVFFTCGGCCVLRVHGWGCCDELLNRSGQSDVYFNVIANGGLVVCEIECLRCGHCVPF